MMLSALKKLMMRKSGKLRKVYWKLFIEIAIR